MKNLNILFLTTLLTACQSNPVLESISSEAKGPNPEELTLAQLCSQYTCRENVRVSYRTEGEPVDLTIPVYWPRVFNDVISILPGESFFVEADIIDGKLENLREVPENADPTKTITIKFTQMEKSVSMMLSLYNPFEKVALKFNMEMIDFDGNPHQTSSCPAVPRGFIFESWPHPIPELIIKNPVLISVKNMKTMSCIY